MTTESRRVTPPEPHAIPKVGDRVWAYYIEHSIPSKSIGTVVAIEGKWITVDCDTERFECGTGLVCTAFTEPVVVALPETTHNTNQDTP